MTARTPIILLVVAAILLAYVLLFERGRPGRTEIDSPPTEQLIPSRRAKIDR